MGSSTEDDTHDCAAYSQLHLWLDPSPGYMRAAAGKVRVVPTSALVSDSAGIVQPNVPFPKRSA
eukprot:6476876-Pyramimonas_sp.AAC.1